MKIEIEEIREAGEYNGDLMGWFCKGHVDKYEFCKAVWTTTDHCMDSDYKTPFEKGVEHVYWRKIPIRGENGFIFHTAKKGQPGAFPATVWDFANYRSQKGFQEDEEHRKQGRAQGQIEAMNFAFIWLRAVKGVATAEELLAAWNKEREPKKEAV